MMNGWMGSRTKNMLWRDLKTETYILFGITRKEKIICKTQKKDNTHQEGYFRSRRKDWSYTGHLCGYGRKERNELAFLLDTSGSGEHPGLSCMYFALKAMWYSLVRTLALTHTSLNIHLALHYILRAKATFNFRKYLLYMNCQKYRWLKIKLNIFITEC